VVESRGLCQRVTAHALLSMTPELRPKTLCKHGKRYLIIRTSIADALVKSDAPVFAIMSHGHICRPYILHARRKKAQTVANMHKQWFACRT